MSILSSSNLFSNNFGCTIATDLTSKGRVRRACYSTICMPIHLATNCTELLRLQYKRKWHRLHVVMQAKLQSYTNKTVNSICSLLLSVLTAAIHFCTSRAFCMAKWYGLSRLSAECRTLPFRAELALTSLSSCFRK